MHEGHKRFEVQGFEMGREVERKIQWRKGKGEADKRLGRQNSTEREPFFSVVFIFALSVFIIFVPSSCVVATIMPYQSLDVNRLKGGIFS